MYYDTNIVPEDYMLMLDVSTEKKQKLTDMYRRIDKVFESIYGECFSWTIDKEHSFVYRSLTERDEAITWDELLEHIPDLEDFLRSYGCIDMVACFKGANSIPIHWHMIP